MSSARTGRDNKKGGNTDLSSDASDHEVKHSDEQWNSIE